LQYGNWKAFVIIDFLKRGRGRLERRREEGDVVGLRE
jgi:hypothetical protein